MMKCTRTLMILALAAFAFGGPAYAQGPTQAHPDSVSHMMQSYRQDIQRLQSIQKQAIKHTPKLAAEMKHYQAEVNTSMRAHGYDMAKGRKRVQAMVAKMRSGKKMSKADRMSTMKSFQSERMKMMKARSAAMQDPKIKKDGKALQQHMIAAMKKQDSHTGPLLEQVKTLRTKIMGAMAARRATAKKGG